MAKIKGKKNKRIMLAISVDSLTTINYKCGSCGETMSIKLYDIEEDQMFGRDCPNKECMNAMEMVSITGEKA
jgi:hypothetical protein